MAGPFCSCRTHEDVTALGFQSTKAYLVWFNIISDKGIWPEITKGAAIELVYAYIYTVPQYSSAKEVAKVTGVSIMPKTTCLTRTFRQSYSA
jgi:hypothetical protein